MIIKAVVFDLDGTLLDTLEDIGESANLVLTKHCFPANPISNYRILTGDGAEVLFRRASHNKASEAVIRTMVKEFQTLYSSRCTSKTKAYDGIIKLLYWLKKSRIHCAVLSNKFHDLTNILIKHYFPLIEFSAIYGQLFGIPIKPDPVQVLNILSQLQCEPCEAMLVGDTCVDMQTAKNAGVFAVGVLWGFRDMNDLVNYGADAVVKSPEEIQNLIINIENGYMAT